MSLGRATRGVPPLQDWTPPSAARTIPPLDDNADADTNFGDFLFGRGEHQPGTNEEGLFPFLYRGLAKEPVAQFERGAERIRGLGRTGVDRIGRDLVEAAVGAGEIIASPLAVLNPAIAGASKAVETLPGGEHLSPERHLANVAEAGGIAGEKIAEFTGADPETRRIARGAGESIASMAPFVVAGYAGVKAKPTPPAFNANRPLYDALKGVPEQTRNRIAKKVEKGEPLTVGERNIVRQRTGPPGPAGAPRAPKPTVPNDELILPSLEDLPDVLVNIRDAEGLPVFTPERIARMTDEERLHYATGGRAGSLRPSKPPPLRQEPTPPAQVSPVDAAPPSIPPLIEEVPASKPAPVPKADQVPLGEVSPAKKLESSARSDVYEAPIEAIATDTKRFQGRDERYSAETVKKIKGAVGEGSFRREVMDPILLWVDPANKTPYVLSGHSRLQSFRELAGEGNADFATIPAKVLQGISEAEAKKIARTSNANATPETVLARARYYREMRGEGGKTLRAIEEEAKRLEGKNATGILNLSHLNPSGRIVDAMNQFGKGVEYSDESRSLVTMGEWIGDLRRRRPELTNTHENELFDYLVENYKTRGRKYSTKGAFNDYIEKVIDKRTEFGQFDASKPLNIESVVPRSRMELEYEQRIIDAETTVGDARKALERKRAELIQRKASPEDMERVLKKYDDDLTHATRELLSLRSNRGGVLAELRASTMDLFGGEAAPGLSFGAGAGQLIDPLIDTTPQIRPAGRATPAGETALTEYSRRLSVGEKEAKSGNLKTFLSDVYRRFVNQENAIEKLQREHGGKAYSYVQRYRGIEGIARGPVMDKTRRLLPDGNMEVTGKGLREILAPFRDSVDDLRSLLTALRDLELSERPNIKGTTPEASHAAVAHLREKWGENFSALLGGAKEIYTWADRAILRPLVEIGALSPEKYEDIKQTNQLYVPYMRVLGEPEFAGLSPAGKNRFQPKSVPIKTIRGSEKRIIDPLESLIRKAQETADFVERARVAREIVAMRDLPGLKDKIVEVHPPVVPVARITRTGLRDAKLREQLLDYAKTLGTKVETKIHLGRPLGYFRPSDLIRLRLIADEHVLAHEIGHRLDHILNLQDRFLRFPDKRTRITIKKELRRLADLREVEPRYARKGEEKVAELIGAFVSSPDLLERETPTTYKVLKDFIDKVPELKPLKDIHRSLVLEVAAMDETIMRPSKFQPKGTIQTFVNGKRKFWKVPDDVRVAVEGLGPGESSLARRLVSYPNRVLRAGATLALEFAARNPIRDQWSAWINAKGYGGYVPFVDLGFGLGELLGGGKFAKDFEASGASHSMLVSLDRAMTQVRLKDALGRPLWQRAAKNVANPLRALQVLSETMEKGTRIGAYRRAKMRGFSDLEAMRQAREITLDFSRMGTEGKTINQIYAFWNANLQGYDKLARRLKEAPTETMTKLVASITIPSLALWLMNKDDPEYQEIPQWQKNVFWLVKVPQPNGESTWLRIPKPFEPGVLFGTMPELMADHIVRKDPTALAKMREYFDLKSVGGALVPTPGRPIVENVANYNFFTDRPIVPPGKQGLPPGMQATRYSTETAKTIGEAFGIAPPMVDNLLRGYGAGLGKLAVDAADKVLIRSGLRRPPERPTPTAADKPLLRAFVVRDPRGSQSESLNRFYQAYEKAEGAYRALNQVQETGRPIGEFIADHPEVYLRKGLADVARSLSEVKQRIDLVMQSTTISADAKAEMIGELESLMTSLAAAALGQSRQMEQRIEEEVRAAK